MGEIKEGISPNFAFKYLVQWEIVCNIVGIRYFKQAKQLLWQVVYYIKCEVSSKSKIIDSEEFRCTVDN